MLCCRSFLTAPPSCFVKYLRSVAIGLIVGAILLAVMPSLRKSNPIAVRNSTSTDETPASYNFCGSPRRSAVVNVYNRSSERYRA